MPSFSESQINYLLHTIEDKRLVPIIGDEVFYCLDREDKIPLQRYIICKLLEDCQIQEQLKGVAIDIDDICRKGCSGLTKLAHLIVGDSSSDSSRRLREVTRSLRDKISIIYKDSLRKINIDDEIISFLKYCNFPLILTTSVFDISKILDFNYGPTIKSKVYQGDSGGDLSDSDITDLENAGISIIYHLFGINGTTYTTPPFVCTDGDLLFYLFRLIDTDRPQNLLRYFGKKYILSLGNNIPDWTFRFLLCTCDSRRHKILLNEHDNNPPVSGAIVGTDNPQPEFEQFLADISYMYGNSLKAFVRDLNPEILKRRKKAFLSILSRDWERQSTSDLAKKLIRALINEGFLVWYAEQNLSNDKSAYWKHIEVGVEDCHIFIPLITDEAIRQSEEYKNSGFNDGELHKDKEPGFITEWKMAQNKRKNNLPFRDTHDEKAFNNALSGTTIWEFFYGGYGVQQSTKIEDLIAKAKDVRYE